VEDHVLPLLSAGKVRPVIYKTFSLQDAAGAHRLIENSAHIRKNVLTGWLIVRFPKKPENSVKSELKRGQRRLFGNFYRRRGHSPGLQGDATDGGPILAITRGLTAVAVVIAASLLAGQTARGVEAVNVRLDAAAIDLTAATDLQKTEGDRIQVSTAP